MVHQFNPYEPADICAVYNSWYDGKNFNSEITQEQIERMPAWPDAEPQPPLPVRQAIALAQELLRRLVHEPDRWRLGEAVLKPFGNHGRWIYLIKFRGFLPPNIIDGIVPNMRIVVLMNGEVIEPIITPAAMNIRHNSDSTAQSTLRRQE